MEVTHTLDLSRLRVLEAVMTSALGASQACRNRLDELDKKLISAQARLRHAEKALADVRRTSVSTHVSGMSITTRVRAGSREGGIAWEDEITKSEAECADLERRIEAAQADQSAEFERFNEASHLHNACKEFAAEHLRDGSDDQ